jgi:UDP-GlcNAc3NAcA epimerase
VKVVSVVGARPQFIKAAAVSTVLRRAADEVLVHTGQHYDDDMSDVFFCELGIPAPDHHLGVGSGSHARQTAEVLTRLEPILAEQRPDWVLTYGDTNSTLGAALTAAKLNLPVAHVEAGLRSFDRAMPEELNRVVTDHLSALCFSPSPAATRNLAREGLAGQTVEVGDVMVDLLLRQLAGLPASCPTLEEHGLQDGQYLVATLHRAANTDDAARLERALGLLNGLGVRVILPMHPRTSAAVERHGLGDLLRDGAITAVPPLGYIELMTLVRGARALLTDSGGLQKEAYVLGTRCITLRPETEWVETVEAGWNTVVDLDLAAARRALDAGAPTQRPPLYGRGDAAQLIVDELLKSTGRPPVSRA